MYTHLILINLPLIFLDNCGKEIAKHNRVKDLVLDGTHDYAPKWDENDFGGRFEQVFMGGNVLIKN
ncbi:MAG: hypothetical protein GY938_24000 [Ketobacter sp.]|nr:hypothetical protein [Ketobacter sp.]